ncbi:MAG: beta strand repeat-containing protein [Candidatus Saccharimonadales bacterium]
MKLKTVWRWVAERSKRLISWPKGKRGWLYRSVAFVMALIVFGVILLQLRPTQASSSVSKIQQEIQLVNCPAVNGYSSNVLVSCSNSTISYVAAATNGNLGLVNWEPSRFGGNLSVYFDAVGNIGTAGQTATFELYDTTANNPIVDATTTSTTTVKITRSADIFSQLIPGHNLCVRLKSSLGGAQANLQSAKLIVDQTFAQGQMTSTATYVELGSNKSKPSGSTSYSDIEDGEYFTYDASKYDGNVSFTLDVTTPSPSSTEQFILVDQTSGVTVPMTSDVGGSCTPDPDALCSNSSAIQRLRGQLSNGLINGHNYNVKYKVNSGSQKDSLINLIISQTPTVDQNQTSSAASQTIQNSSDSLTQTFQVSHSGYYSGASICVADTSTSPTDVLNLDLTNNSGTSQLAGKLSLSPSLLSTTASNNSLFFNHPIWLSSSTTYKLVLSRSGASDTNHYYTLCTSASGSDNYASGTLSNASGSLSQDLTFSIYTNNYPTKFETYNQLANGGTGVGTNKAGILNPPNPGGCTNSTMYSQGYLVNYEGADTQRFSRTKINTYFEVTAEALSAGLPSAGNTISAQLYNATDSSAIGASTVAQTSSSSGFSNIRSSEISGSLPANKNLDTRISIDNCSFQTVIAKSVIVLDVTLAPNVLAVASNTGPTGGGTPITIYGNGFQAGATVSIGGNPATQVYVVNPTTITALSPAGSAGTQDVTVTNPSPDLQDGSLVKGFTYSAGMVVVAKTVNSGFSSGTLSNLTSGIANNANNFAWKPYVNSASGGSLAAATYTYVVTGVDEVGNETAASPQSPAITTSGSTSKITLSWQPIQNAYQYKLYRTSTGTFGASSLLATLTTTQASTANNPITYTDTGSATSSGTPPSDSTDRGLRLQPGTVPSGGAGTFSAGPTLSSGAAHAGTLGIKLPNGNYLIVQGNNTTTTSVYDPVANSMSAGPALPSPAYSGANAMERPDGQFMIVLGITNTTAIYNPYTNAMSAGPTMATGCGVSFNCVGSTSFKLPNGNFMFINGGSSLSTNIYDPVANSFTTGPNLSATSREDAIVIPRTDGTYAILVGGVNNVIDIYNPNNNTLPESAHILGGSLGSGSMAIQRSDGKYLILMGGSTIAACLYDPGAITSSDCTSVSGAGNVPSASIGYGASAIRRPDGKYLIIHGNNSTSTSKYDPSATASAFTSGPTLSGSAAFIGSFSIQRPDGKYLLVKGGNTSSTNIYDAGWNIGTAAQNGNIGTYTSEALHRTDLASWQSIGWQPTTDYDITKVEVKTAINQTGLDSLATAAWRTISNNGSSIGAGSNEVWLQVRITFVRNLPGFTASHKSGPDIWGGDGFNASQRYFADPTIKSLTLTYNQATVSSIAPNTGKASGGTPFTITGAGFEAGASVKIGGQPATSILVVNSTTITGITPSGASGARDVVVHNPVANIDATLPAGFTYKDNYDQINKTVNSEFSTGTTLTNLSSGGIKFNEGAFQMLSVDSSNSAQVGCYNGSAAKGSSNAPCTYAGNTSLSSGGLSSGTYYYVVTALDKDGYETAKSIETGGTAVLTSGGSIQLKWRPVVGALSYKVYRTSTHGSYSSPALLVGIITAGSGGSSPLNGDITFLDTATNPSTGAPSSDTTKGELQLNRYSTIPNTIGPCFDLPGGAVAGAGAFAVQRPDGKFLIFIAGGSDNSYIYDGTTGSCAPGTLTAGPSAKDTLGAGAYAIERPDGKFLIIHGGVKSTTSLYDPVGNTMSNGPSLPGTVGAGGFAIRLPSTGNYLVFAGNGTTNDYVYDVTGNSFSTNSTASNLALSDGSHAIYRYSSQSFLIAQGGGSNMEVYDPATNSFTTSASRFSSTSNFLTVGSGANSFQGDDGLYLTVLGAGTNKILDVIDPISAGNTSNVSAGSTSLPGTFSAAQLSGTVGAGSNAIERPDGSYLIVQGGDTASTSVVTDTASVTTGPNLSSSGNGKAGVGSFSFQRQDGKYVIIHGDNSGGSSLYDAGWITGTTAQGGTVGTYESEPLNNGSVSSWDKISWVQGHQGTIQASDNTVDQIEVRTATSSGGLSSATYRKVSNGDSIGAGIGEIWLQYKITFKRTVPTWSYPDRPGADVWLGSDVAAQARDFNTPDIQSITASYNTTTGTAVSSAPTSLAQLRLDGITSLAVGEATSEDKIVFSGQMTSPNSSDSVQLEVEVEPVGTSFTNTPNVIGSFQSCSGGTCATGVNGTASVLGLTGASYHWQARTRGSGGAGSWASFGGNAESATDFTQVLLQNLLRHGQTFINESQQPLCSTHFCGP